MRAVQEGPESRYEELSLENLGKLEGRIAASFDKVDPAWFLTEETKKTRERYLYISALCVLFLLTKPGAVSVKWPVEVVLVIQHRYLLDLSLICICLGVGVNYLISARSELAQINYNWKMAAATAKTLASEVNEYVVESKELLNSKPSDPKYAPIGVRPRLRQIEIKAEAMDRHVKELSRKNEQIAIWGNRMPWLTFATPIVIIILAFALRK